MSSGKSCSSSTARRLGVDVVDEGTSDSVLWKYRILIAARRFECALRSPSGLWSP